MPLGSDVLVFISEDQLDDLFEAIGTIIHESVHVFYAFQKFIGEEHPGEETIAYTTEHIALTLIKELYAIHEKREAGLQAGKCVVQLEAGTAEESQ